MRSTESEQSKGFAKTSNQNSACLQKTNESFFDKVCSKIRSITYNSASKIITYIIIVSVFSWFGINIKNIASGVVSIIHGDITGGVGMIAQTIELNVLFGEDPRWEEYKEETGNDLSDSFVYLGDGKSISKSIIMISDINESEDCDEDCNNPIYGLPYDDANEICMEKYGAMLPTYKELENAIGGFNPLTHFRLDKSNEYPEMSYTLDPEDDDKVKLFYKEYHGSMSGYPEYAELNSPIMLSSTFRCFKKL